MFYLTNGIISFFFLIFGIAIRQETLESVGVAPTVHRQQTTSQSATVSWFMYLEVDKVFVQVQ